MNTQEREFTDDATDAWFVVGKVFAVIFLVTGIIFWIWGDRLIHGKIGCAFYNLLHIYCPGCGCTRAYYWMVHFHPWRSFLCNPFIIVSFVMYLVFMLNTVLVRHTKHLGFKGFPVTSLVYSTFVILGVQWIVRNILYIGYNITVL